MKKIGILAFFHPKTKNYGAILQTFALSKTLQQLGYEVQLIDIIPAQKKRSLLSSLKHKIKGCMEGNPFRTFLKSQVSLSQPLHTFAELNEQAKHYNAVIVGSDQVWRPEYCGDHALHYFLDFVPAGVKRISYAASFGLDTWIENENTTEKIKKEVAKFNAVSVRELVGVGICQQVFGVNASHVIDPTLLAGESLFNSLLPKSNTSQPYVASFILDRNEETEALESYISKQTDKSIYALNKRETGFLGFTWDKYLTIKQWLTKIRDAEMVITDSFHCVCFSLLFQKQFICFGNPSRGLSRLNSLLEIVGLEDRLFLNLNQVKEATSWTKTIDYTHVNDHLRKQRSISLNFLKNSLA